MIKFCNSLQNSKYKKIIPTEKMIFYYEKYSLKTYFRQTLI